MKYFLSVLLIGLTITTGCGSSGAPKSPTPVSTPEVKCEPISYHRGFNAFEKGDYENANFYLATYLNNCVGTGHDDQIAYAKFMLGYCYEQKAIDGTLSTAQRALFASQCKTFYRSYTTDPNAVNSHSSRAYEGMARVDYYLFDKGVGVKEADIIRNIDAAAALSNGRTDPYEPLRLKGNFYNLQGKPDKAKVVFEDILKKDPQNTWAHIGLATAQESLGDLTDARLHLCMALALDPANAVATKGVSRLKATCR